MTNVKSLLEMYVKMGGSLTDTYSDIAGGVPVGQYSTISDAILACSKKYSAGGGGGAEKFVVNIIDNAGYTADKTFAEIKAAYDAGKDVEATIYIGIFATTIKAVLSFVNADTAEFVGFVYSPLDTKTRIYSCYCYTGGGSDGWNSHTVVVEDFPSYSSSQNGKILGVSSGSLAWVESNAPLIVTLTAGQTEGQFVGDKTNKEVYDAFAAGQAVVLSASVGSATFKLAVQYASYDGTDYEFAFIYSASVKNTVSGGANDFVTASLA